MPLLMEKEITTNKIILTNYEIFRALDDPIRGKIVQLLYKKQLNVEQISRRLKKFGYKKAVTTIRHHIEILKNSGLIEISKIEEARGGITKYYASSAKLLDFTLPADFDKNYSKLISKTSLKLGKIVGPISKIFQKHVKYSKLTITTSLLWKLLIEQ